MAGCVALSACAGVAAPETSSESPRAVTPPPSPGAFACPAQVLAGAPPSTRLVDVRLGSEPGFDRVTFAFEPGPPDKPAASAGVIVRPVEVPPQTKANGDPLSLADPHYLEVRFRDMAVTAADGSRAFRGTGDITSAEGSVRDVVELQETPLIVDWLIGMTTECARVWQDGTSALVVEVQRP
jgi:hypothetical protein